MKEGQGGREGRSKKIYSEEGQVGVGRNGRGERRIGRWNGGESGSEAAGGGRDEPLACPGIALQPA
jgi:hypothetical protein